MLKEACNRVHDFYEKPHDQVIDVGVSVDGTWMTRGFMSKFGVTAANSCETGEVLDFEIMCRVCELCKAYKINHTQQEFMDWWVIHKNSDECQINHTENSGLMGVLLLQLFSSVQNRSRNLGLLQCLATAIR